MIGLIQRTLLLTVERLGGPDAVAAVLDRAGVPADAAYRIDRDYPDDECARLIAATVATFGVPEDEVYRAFSVTFLEEARRMFPRFFEISRSGYDLLRRQPSIHASLAAGLRDGDTPHAATRKFQVTVVDADTIDVLYASPNRLCGLYRALAREVAREYGEEIRIEEHTCQNRGADACRMTLAWDRGTSAEPARQRAAA